MITMKNFSCVTVGVGDLDQALALWQESFGLETVARMDGPDSGLAQLWDFSELQDRLNSMGVPVLTHDSVSTLTVEGPAVEFFSLAGFKIVCADSAL